MKYLNPVHFNEEVYQYIGNHQTPIIHALAGITYPDENYKILYNNPPRYSFEYVYEGYGTVQLGANSFEAGPGDFFILLPNQCQNYFSNKDNPWKKIFLVVEFNIDFISSLMSSYNIDQIFHIPGANNPFYLDEIFNLVKNDDGNIHRALEKNCLMMIGAISDFLKNADIESNLIIKAKKYIDKRIYSRIPVKEVSKYVNLQHDYFTRLFKKNIGITPSEYIKREKIEKSKIMLSTSTLSVCEIALKLGYGDASHFNHTFTSCCGISPSQYRANTLL